MFMLFRLFHYFRFSSSSCKTRCLRAAIVWSSHPFEHIQLLQNCCERPLFGCIFSVTADRWWSLRWCLSICFRRGCKSPRSLKNTEAGTAPKPGSKSIRGSPNPPGAPFYSVWMERRGKKNPRWGQVLLFTSMSVSVTSVCWGDFCTLLEKKGGEAELLLISKARAASPRKT